jgi:hypothetical protein
VSQSQLPKFRLVKTGIEGNVWIETREHFTDESIRNDSGSCLMTHFSLSSVKLRALLDWLFNCMCVLLHRPIGRL